jgi:hypothetical protein
MTRGKGDDVEQVARDVIAAAVTVLRGDELEVLALVAQGLARGRRQYGYLDLAVDRRDMVGETLEEIRDGLVYIGAALVRQRRRGDR